MAVILGIRHFRRLQTISSYHKLFTQVILPSNNATSSRTRLLQASGKESLKISSLHTSSSHLMSSSGLSKREQLKKAVKEYGPYGPIFMIFHVTIALMSLGGFYVAISSGIDMVTMVSHLPYIGKQLASSKFGTAASTFTVAYTIHKLFAPVRIGITLTCTPIIVQYLRQKGIFLKMGRGYNILKQKLKSFFQSK